jgi:hypothetical protein
MIAPIALLGLFVAWRLLRAVLASLRALPRSNEDWVWY